MQWLFNLQFYFYRCKCSSNFTFTDLQFTVPSTRNITITTVHLSVQNGALSPPSPPPPPHLLLEKLEALLVENLNKFTLEVLIAVPCTPGNRLVRCYIIQHV